MKHLSLLLIGLMLFNVIQEHETTESCYACSDHPAVIEERLWEWDGEEIPSKYRVMKQELYHGCRLHKTLLHVYEGRHKVKKITL